jgi:homocysteine S-methyltransferase
MKKMIIVDPKTVSFIDALRKGPLVFDGAVGTALYERGIPYTTSFEQASVSQPEVVRQVHQAYLNAGANVITTNSFGANAYRLKLHDLDGQVAQINRAAARLAREVAADKAFVAASIGPTGLLLKTIQKDECQNIRQAFLDQCLVLCDEDIDVLLLETFRQTEEIGLALEAARQASNGRFPIIASVSFDPGGTMADGSGPEEVAEKLAQWGADAIGVKCADGPAGVYEMVTRMAGAGLPLIAQPNAGLPRQLEGRLAYIATPDYFQLYARRLYKAGIKAVGGCCGTTAEHIKQIAAAARMAAAAGPVDQGGGMRDDLKETAAVAPGISITPTAEKGELGHKLGKKFIVSVEVNPPPGLSLQKALDGAALLKKGGVDVINVADGPRASARMGNIALCLRIQETLGIPTLMHVTTRDRNLLGLVSFLLASHELGVRNLVVITGDPPKMGDFPDATAVFDLDSIGLLRLIRGLNRGLDPGGKALGGATSFLCAAGAEPAAHDYQREIKRLHEKVEAGAEFIMTQPVYDREVLNRFLLDVEPLGIPVLLGLLPLASYRNAEFLHNEVPGMSVPDAIRKRMRQAGGGAGARAQGVAIAQDMLAEFKDRVAGVYIMPPFGRYELALDIIGGVV